MSTEHTNNTSKKQYAKPKLVTYGSIAALTQKSSNEDGSSGQGHKVRPNSVFDPLPLFGPDYRR